MFIHIPLNVIKCAICIRWSGCCFPSAFYELMQEVDRKPGPLPKTCYGFLLASCTDCAQSVARD